MSVFTSLSPFRGRLRALVPAILFAACMLCSCGVFHAARPVTPVPGTDDFYRTYSEKFGIHLDGTEHRGLLTAVDAWLDTPYKMGGCSKKGVDCSCFVQSVFRQAYGIALSRTSHEMFNDVIKVDKSRLCMGDLVFLRNGKRKIYHVGIYLKDNKFVHVTTVNGVIISSLQEKYYKKHFYAAGRVKDLHQT